MTDVKFYKNNLQKTFEDVAERFYGWYPNHTSKLILISKQFYDFLGDDNTRSCIETLLGTLITIKAKNDRPNDEFHFAVCLRTRKDELFGDYYLIVEACDCDDDYEKYCEIMSKKG